MQSLKQHFVLIDELRKDFIPPPAVPVIAVVGPFNTGKSTLINGLLGQGISPVDVIPTTSANMHFSYGERFRARVHYDPGQVMVSTPLELNQLLTPKAHRSPKILKVEVELPHQLLQRLSLVDTPGIDAAGTTNLLAHQLESMHHVTYLLHQRGPSEVDRQFIQKLVQIKGAGRLSFWINCNLGQWDGSSLEEARRVLREICHREVTVLVINTRDPSDVEKFNYFIQDQAATAILGQVVSTLKEQNRKIPAIVASALEKNNDADFLAEFWQAREYARQVLQGQKLMQTIPPVTQKIKQMLEETGSKTIVDQSVPVAYTGPEGIPDPAMVRANIRSLFQTIRTAPELSRYPRTLDQIEKLIQKLDQEQYLVTAVGGFSSGKSTFFNAMLGEPLLPAENRPTTFAITLLKAGPVKKAIIIYAKQVKIPTRQLDKNSAVICRHELAILERWLTDTGLRRQIVALEKSKDGKLAAISAPELLIELEQLKTTFARVKRNFPQGKRPWKSLFKKIPIGKFKKDSPADFYVVHFAQADQKEINLETQAGRAALAETAGSHLALRVETIEIWHPAAPLRLATFVDTPGLDSVYRRHREITTRYLPNSDCFLLMLNGKHILTKPDLGLTHTILEAFSHHNSPPQKLFVVVNFTDTLTAREQEKVRNYLNHKLVKPSGGGVRSDRIYFISAQQALLGQKSGEFSRLTRHLKEQIWSFRCQDKYQQYLNQGSMILKSIDSPTPPPENRAQGPKPDRLIAVAELTSFIKQKMTSWHSMVNAFNSSKDFVGLREGKLVIRKGFLGLSRQVLQVPSCQDLARDINTPLTTFQQQWLGETNINLQGINATQLEKAMEILLAQSSSLTEAKQAVLELLAREESRIKASLQQIEQHWENSFEQCARTTQTSNKIAPDLKKALDQYLAALGQLEQNILPPGGIKDGKRQNAG